MIAVPDAGPLIYLAGAGQIDLLRVLFERVIVPRIVHDEVVVSGEGLVGAVEVACATWIEIEDVEPDDTLVGELDPGEATAIPLAQRLGATLLCDDSQARDAARRRGLVVVGSLGVLLRAKDLGRVALIAPIVDRMRELGMFVSAELLAEVLSLAGEG